MSEPESTSRPIASAVLEDGRIVEMIHRRESRQTGLLVWDGKTATETDTVEQLRPYSPENNLITHAVVLFPSAIGETRSDEELLAEVRTFIHQYADLSEPFEELAALYVLLTWVYDAFSELPYLRLKGDYGSGKSRCLQTIGSLCYKPIFASGASTTSPLFRILDAFRGTLILDESDFRFSDERQEIVKILNNGNAHGFPVLRSEATPQKEFNPRAFHVYGPKIIATRRDFEDRALESRCITEAMSGLPPRTDIPLNLPKPFHEESTAIRNRLLAYRFRSLSIPRDLSAYRERGVEARIAQVFAPLLCVAPNDELRTRIRAYAKSASRNLKDDRSTSLEAQLLEAIKALLAEGQPLGVKDIAQKFSEANSLEYERPITARWIGAQLRSRLSLSPVKSHGSFVIPKDNEKLAGLFERYGVEIRVDMGTLGTLPEVPETIGLDF